MQRLKSIRDRMAAVNDDEPVPEWNPALRAPTLAGMEFDADSLSPAEAPEAAMPSPAPEAAPDPVPAAAPAANMWDMIGLPEDDVEDAAPLPELGAVVAAFPRAVRTPEPEAVSARDDALPDAAPRRSGRVKTRLLGFDHSNGKTENVLEKSRETAAQGAGAVQFPVGWIVVVKGPGRGNSVPLMPGVSQIGRGEDQAIQLDFGDTTISRENHASVAYDIEDRKFYIGHGGKSNIVRLNGKPLLSTEAIASGDEIRIGETTLRLVALCGPAFSWTETPEASLSAHG